MKNRMAILSGQEDIACVENELNDKLQERDLLIKIEACNICTSEYGIYSGARKAKFPYTIGHEWSGHVVRCGTGVTRFKVGDYVVGCYEYDPASEEAQVGNSSSSPRTYAYDQLNDNGYYGRFRACAEYLIQPEISTFKMNETVDPSEAAFLEPLSTVISGIKKMDLKVTDTVLVIGAGTMGILNALVASSYGATVVSTEFMPKKVEVARALGLQTIQLRGSSLEEHVEQIKTESKIASFDKVIVAVGVSGAYQQAFRMLKRNDGLALLFAAGYPEPDLGISANEIHYRKMTIVGTYTANYQDFKDAAFLLSTGKIKVSLLVENRVPLSDIDAAMRQAIVPGAFRISVLCS